MNPIKLLYLITAIVVLVVGNLFMNDLFNRQQDNSIEAKSYHLNMNKQGRTANIVDYGAQQDGQTDSTDSILAAIKENDIIIFPKGIYVTGPLQMHSDKKLLFEPGVTIKARQGFGIKETLINFDGVSNVDIEGNGAIFEMPKEEYTNGEWRHIFNLRNCSYIVINNVVARNSGGDGFYINGAKYLFLNKIIAENNYRQGCSIISAKNIVMIEPVFRNTTGTSPGCGIDFEPNSDMDYFEDIRIYKAIFENNDGNGIQFYMRKFNRKSNLVKISILIDNPILINNRKNGIRISKVNAPQGIVGSIEIVKPSFNGNYYGEILIEDNNDPSVVRIDK